MVIVGAGIIGLSCAWRLAQRGLSVEVFDAREAAREASWAGAGMLAPGGEFDAVSPLAASAMRSLQAYPEYIGELEEESGESIDYRHSGAIDVAFTDAEWAALRSRSLRQHELGIETEACTYRGHPALYYAGDAVVDPRNVTSALLAACRRRGAVIHEHEAVLAVSPQGTGVITASGEHAAEGVLIAAGAWSSSLLPGLPATWPVRGHLIRWELEPGFLNPIVRRGHTYILQRRSGLLIAGASTENVGFDRTLDPAAVSAIQSEAGLLVPRLASLAPEACWNGFRPGVETGGPIVRKLPDVPVWAAFGHYRNGILLAPETARQVAALVP